MKYYIDESGNSGDLIKEKMDFSFDNQPFFVLACIEENTSWDAENFIKKIRVANSIKSQELDCASLYKNKPMVLCEILSEIIKNTNILAEVVDKKYFICTTITNTQLWPPYFRDTTDITNERRIISIISDFIYVFLKKEDYRLYCKSCITQDFNDIELSIKNFEEIGMFLEKNIWHCKEFYAFCNLLIEASKETLDDMSKITKLQSKEKSSLFIALPDKDAKGKTIHLLPHISSFLNIYARVNKKHESKLDEIIFIHDEQKQFGNIITTTKQNAELAKLVNNPTKYVDFKFTSSAKLEFGISHESYWLQLTDLVAGFLSRYARDRFFLSKEMPEIFNTIFQKLSQPGPYGINLVMPLSKRHGFSESIWQ